MTESALPKMRTVKDRLLSIRKKLHAAEGEELGTIESLDWSDFKDWNNGPAFKEFTSTPGWEKDWNRGW